MSMHFNPSVSVFKHTVLKSIYFLHSALSRGTQLKNAFFPLPELRDWFARGVNKRSATSLLQQPSTVDAFSTTAGCLSPQTPLIYTAAGDTLGITTYKKQYNMVSIYMWSGQIGSLLILRYICKKVRTITSTIIFNNMSKLNWKIEVFLA